MSRRESDFDCARLADAAAYVLGSLAHDELNSFREHLAGCAQCRSEVDALQPLQSTSCPRALQRPAAPAALRERVLAIVRAEAELLHAAGPAADEPPRAQRRWRQRSDFALGIGAAAAAGLAALVAVLIAVGLGGHAKLTVTEGKGLGRARTAQVSLRQRDGHSELVVAHMPQPAVGRIYEEYGSAAARAT